MVNRAVGFEDQRKLELSFLSILLKFILGLLSIILPPVFSQHHQIHAAGTILSRFFIFNEAIDSNVKCLHVFINSLLIFITRLFVKP